MKCYFMASFSILFGGKDGCRSKLAAVKRLEQGVSIGEVARALEVNPNVLHRWRREFRQGPGNVFPGHGKQRWAEGRIAELERKIGQQALEIGKRLVNRSS